VAFRNEVGNFIAENYPMAMRYAQSRSGPHQIDPWELNKLRCGGHPADPTPLTFVLLFY